MEILYCNRLPLLHAEHLVAVILQSDIHQQAYPLLQQRLTNHRYDINKDGTHHLIAEAARVFLGDACMCNWKLISSICWVTAVPSNPDYRLGMLGKSLLVSRRCNVIKRKGNQPPGGGKKLFWPFRSISIRFPLAWVKQG